MRIDKEYLKRHFGNGKISYKENTMKTTRQYINEAALGLATILGILTQKSNDDIDHLMDNPEAEGLNEIIQGLLENVKKGEQ